MKTISKNAAEKQLVALQKKKQELLKSKNELEAIEKKEVALKEVIANANKPKDITQIVTSFETACKYFKKTPKSVLPYANPKNDDEIYLNHVAMLNIIIKAWRGDWIPDYSNPNQYKWFPYFEYKKAGRSSGFVYSDSGYDCDYSYSYCGSRHVFETKEKAIRAGKIFENIYNVILTLGSKK